VTPDKTVNQRNVKTGVQDGDNIQILSGVKPGDTVVIDGADRLRDGADVEIPKPVGQIVAPSGGGDEDAVRAARRKAMQAALAKACGDDVKKLCPTAQPGSREARMCLFQNRDSLSAECSTAVSQMRRGAGGGRRAGGGGGP
jgi:multidrug efflux system membrane fusion protein